MTVFNSGSGSSGGSGGDDYTLCTQPLSDIVTITPNGSTFNIQIPDIRVDVITKRSGQTDYMSICFSSMTMNNCSSEVYIYLSIQGGAPYMYLDMNYLTLAGLDGSDAFNRWMGTTSVNNQITTSSIDVSALTANTPYYRLWVKGGGRELVLLLMILALLYEGARA